MRTLKFLAFILFFVASMLFFLENKEVLSQGLTLNYRLLELSWTSIPIPVYLLLLAAFLAGGLACLIFLLLERVRLGRQVRTGAAQIRRLEQELNALRNLPLGPDFRPSSATPSPGQAGPQS